MIIYVIFVFYIEMFLKGNLRKIPELKKIVKGWLLGGAKREICEQNSQGNGGLPRRHREGLCPLKRFFCLKCSQISWRVHILYVCGQMH